MSGIILPSEGGNVTWGPLSLDEIFDWLDKYRMTPWNLLPLVTTSDKTPSPQAIIGSMEFHLRAFAAAVPELGGK